MEDARRDEVEARRQADKAAVVANEADSQEANAVTNLQKMESQAAAKVEAARASAKKSYVLQEEVEEKNAAVETAGRAWVESQGT